MTIQLVDKENLWTNTNTDECHTLFTSALNIFILKATICNYFLFSSGQNKNSRHDSWSDDIFLDTLCGMYFSQSHWCTMIDALRCGDHRQHIHLCRTAVPNHNPHNKNKLSKQRAIKREKFMIAALKRQVINIFCHHLLIILKSFQADSAVLILHIWMHKYLSITVCKNIKTG